MCLTCLVVCGCARPVSNDLESSKDLSDCEESNNLSSNNADSRELLAVHVSDLADGLERVRWASCAWVSDGVEKVLAVGLESSRGAVRV